MKENELYWADEKEAIKTNKPLKLLLTLFKIFPKPIIRLITYPVAFFFLRHNERIGPESLVYQKNLQEFTNGQSPKKISPYRQVLSFSLCIVEKMEGWLGKTKFSSISYEDDDVGQLLDQLKQGQGAFLITSHLGNMELMRSLSDYNRQLVGRDVPVIVVMEVNPQEQFFNTLKEVNPKFSLNIINSREIGPDTICTLEEEIEKGSLVIIAGDRTSAHARDKFITHHFFGKPAPFPYGTFLVPFLIKCPVYYMFGFRKKTTIWNPQYKIYIEKSKINFECSRAEREENIKKCCAEFAGKMEKFCKMYPYQWYNFYNFWNFDTKNPKSIENLDAKES